MLTTRRVRIILQTSLGSKKAPRLGRETVTGVISMKISIIGAAGCVGSSAAFNIATQGLASDMVLADIRQNVLENHFIDIVNAAVASKKDLSIRIGNHEDIGGSNIVIIAAGLSVGAKALAAESNPVPKQAIHSRQQLVADNLVIIQEWAQAIAQFCPDAIVITVTNPVEVLNYASYLLSSTRDRKKFIGYSFNDSVRFRLGVAQAIGVEPSRVKAIVIGEHGDNQVPLFSSVQIDGKPISLSEEVKFKLRKHAAEHMRYLISLKAGRSSGWLTGLGLANMVKIIAADAREVIACCAVLAGEYGCQGFSMGVPVILGRQGLNEIIEFELSPDERKWLKKSVSSVKAATQYIYDTLSMSLDK